ncbi:LacI family DNA-binding transcriptional regulator [Aquibacillus halophilus]|uniref:LacI family DNA-binding transcriptional regulator n=1 Tax=Aquibacillus halophilus TaxID=930132 RepID=A0A6A8DL51_9BACI|nr:LacI family DNA-binding transcriptional regulator [Aquibacillus halophilus]MRH44479.1 LacI family DNA-binding transcriptional regulator [Aquibacillus halophilus]
MGKTTMADVAKKAGVSKSTVSQFLNERYEYMSPDTRIRIEAAIDELNYQPNYLARSLKQKRTSTVGIIVANIMHQFSTEVSRSVEDYFNKHNMHAIVCNADNDPEKEKKYIEMLRAKQVDGLIIFPTAQNADIYKNMIKEEYPVVFMDRKVPDLQAPTVVSQNIEATYSAIQHFIDNGHERIAIATEPLTISPRIERHEGYKKALHANGIKINPEFQISTSIDKIKKELDRLFQLDAPPTAILAGNDIVFIEVLEFAKEKKLEVGESFALVVFDNIPFAHFVHPPVTTIAQSAYMMGEKAADLLLKQINKEQIDRHEVSFPCELIIRDSSKRLKEK